MFESEVERKGEGMRGVERLVCAALLAQAFLKHSSGVCGDASTGGAGQQAISLVPHLYFR